MLCPEEPFPEPCSSSWSGEPQPLNPALIPSLCVTLRQTLLNKLQQEHAFVDRLKMFTKMQPTV